MKVKHGAFPLPGTRFFACTKQSSLFIVTVSNISYMFMKICKKMYTSSLFFSVICIGTIIAILTACILLHSKWREGESAQNKKYGSSQQTKMRLPFKGGLLIHEEKA
ncbi:hypothetical protein C7R92_24955 [Brevibacillus porteri]|uniref:Uncharacterized protein n=1 Tax=Brevibacillus porteri TaxID=2126350 RepID=A0ABX5FII5_9BACL|nr:hypothetical protein C7R92_24955 [Brevibacillus porteri]